MAVSALNVSPLRLLGLDFAAADLLVEIGEDERVAFAVGDASVLANGDESALVGSHWRTLVDAPDRPMIEALFAGLEPGSRRGPVIARLPGQDGRAFSISACRLPTGSAPLSCAIARSGSAASSSDGRLLDREVFEAMAKDLVETSARGGPALELAMVEMSGLAKTSSALSPEDARELQARLEGALRAQAHGGWAASAIGPERYALVRPAGEAPQALAARLSKLIGMVAEGADVQVTAQATPLSGGFSPAQLARAIQCALDDFMDDGVSDRPPASMSELFDASVRATLKKADAVSALVAERRFTLAFQPVVRLASGKLHHHEVLVRFDREGSPFPTIKMAEALDLIEGLDLAIAERALEVLAEGGGDLRLAVNMSGRSIASPSYIAALLQLIDRQKAVRQRLMFEVTESAAIEDFALANENIQTLRALGCHVCLDDFGAGAASLAYLQKLHLDIVKIDGQYIRDLQHGSRESGFVKQLVRMCSELGVKTIAEMVETDQAEEAIRRAGVDFAQGWLYGAAADSPLPPARRATGPVAARRAGVVESWG